MKIEIKRDLNSTNMIIGELEQADPEDDALQMILQNHIPDLVPVETETINGDLRLVYHISSLTALSESMEHTSFSREDLRTLITGIGSCMQKLKEYLLDPKKLLLRPDCVFIDRTEPDQKHGMFCYHPFYNGDQQKDLQSLFERIIASIDYEDQELVHMAYKMYMKVQEEHLQWKELEDLLGEKEDAREVFIRDFFEEREFKEDLLSWEGSSDPQQIHSADISGDGSYGKSSFGKSSYGKSSYGKSSDGNNAGRSNAGQDRSFFDLREDIQSVEREPEGHSMPFRPADLPGDEATPETFFQKLKMYLKGKGIREVITDIDDGMILQKIHMEGENKKETLAWQPAERSKADRRRSEYKSAEYASENWQQPEWRTEDRVREERQSPWQSTEQKKTERRKSEWQPAEQKKEDRHQPEWQSAEYMRADQRSDDRRKMSEQQGSRQLVSTDASDPEIIELTRVPFHIGKLDGSSDYVLDSATVSRNHACIYPDPQHGGDYLIEDQRSRNGTYINGVRIRPYVRTRIRPGDHIRLADREFILQP